MTNKKRKPVVFQLTRRNEKPSIAGKNYPVSHRIPSEDEVYDEETGRNRMIRYAIGEQSIYLDEQTSDNPVLGDIVFENGILVVQYQQVTLREFLQTSNWNKSNPDRMTTKRIIYDALDGEVDAQKNLENLEVEFHAMELLMEMDAQKMIGYARALGVNVDRSMYEIKHDMMIMAKNQPQLFLDEISNPKTERMQVVLDAEDERVIVVNAAKRQVFWGFGTKEVITTVPVGIDPKAHFVDYTFGDEGQEVFKKIKKVLAGEVAPTNEKVKATSKA
tara:strand:+ start:431 stop:1255 length:825 start_codon:yes stop_codon:yes gene_type:complete